MEQIWPILTVLCRVMWLDISGDLLASTVCWSWIHVGYKTFGTPTLAGGVLGWSLPWTLNVDVDLLLSCACKRRLWWALLHPCLGKWTWIVDGTKWKLVWQDTDVGAMIWISELRRRSALEEMIQQNATQKLFRQEILKGAYNRKRK
jgi:hypothetical protein